MNFDVVRSEPPLAAPVAAAEVAASPRVRALPPARESRVPRSATARETPTLTAQESAPETPPAPDPSSIPSRADPRTSTATTTPNMPSTASARPLDLSARAAAHTLIAETEASWTLAKQEARAADTLDRAHEARLAQDVPELSREGHDPELALHIAQDVNSVIANPWALILQPLRAARYRYRGTGFDAVIRADGSVQYRSKDSLSLSGGTAKNIDGEPVPVAGLGSHGSPVEKWLGHDVHAGERRRFLEQTRPLRELLHERGVRAALARADVHLSERLKAIGLKLGGSDPQRGRAELFALWDECSEDEVGSKVRNRIERFVREQCEPGTNQTFSSAELIALNQKRVSKQPFQPYAQSRDGGLAPILDADVSALAR